MGEDKKKTPYLAKAAQLVKSNAVQPKMAGVLGFCPRGKEVQATKELTSLLNEYADKLYGEQKGNLKTSTSVVNNEAEEDSDEDDEAGLSVEDAFAKEIAGFKKGASQRRFKWLTVGIECCIFVKCHESVCPTALVSAIMKDLFDTKVQKTRFLQRILPAAETCLAFMDQIVPMAQRVLPKYFSAEGMEPQKFAIVWARRNNDTIERETLIPELAAIVTSTIPHTVELKNPDLCVVVEIFKSICAISVVENYYQYKKFNVESIHGRNANNSQNKKQGDGSTAAPKAPKQKMLRDVKRKREETEASPQDVNQISSAEKVDETEKIAASGVEATVSKKTKKDKKNDTRRSKKEKAAE